MTPSTERLPVVPIPEQGLITLVGADVVDDRSRGHVALGFAHAAKLVAGLLQEGPPSPLPPAVIAALAGRASPSVVLPIPFSLGSCCEGFVERRAGWDGSTPRHYLRKNPIPALD